MTTRSTVLGRYRTTGSRESHTLFTVPSGYVAIFKQLNVSTQNSVQANISAYSQDASGIHVIGWLSRVLAPGAPVQVAAWFMMNPLDNMVVYADTPLVTFWASGTLLPQPPA